MLHEVPPKGLHRNLLSHEGLGGNLNVKQVKREVERSTCGGGWPAKRDLCVGRGSYLSVWQGANDSELALSWPVQFKSSRCLPIFQGKSIKE